MVVLSPSDSTYEFSRAEHLPWIEENLEFAERTARNYMRVFAHREEVKSASVADLNRAYRLLADTSEESEAIGATSRSLIYG